MFEAVELGRETSKKAFKAQERELRTELLRAQHAAQDAGVAVCIIVQGMQGSGRGALVNRLHKWLDTRGVRTHVFWDETREERERPWYWRFWRCLPARGEVAVLFGGWYECPLRARAFDRIEPDAFEAALRRSNRFERMLCDDGVLVLKFWLHVSERVQRRRLKEQVRNGRRLTREEQRFQRHYPRVRTAAEHLIRFTDSGRSPWYLVEAEDRRFRDLTVGRTLLETLQRRLRQPQAERRNPPVRSTALPDESGASVLDKVNLGQSLPSKEYKRQKRDLRTRIGALAWDAYHARRSTVIVLEGWDASGKGGAIRRVSSAIDSRLRRVIATGPPSDEEQAHHYLWRFWRQVPRDGYVTIYDRSWYGRVLVERVDGLATPSEWMRAYEEINEFEQQLVEHGTLLLKFWLHISEDEQLRRFHKRQDTPWKRYKLGGDDWRNRERREEYLHAVDEMVARTSTAQAPWRLVAGEDKRTARISILDDLCAGLERQLEAGQKKR